MPPSPQKARPQAQPHAQIVTANALLEGDVIYLTATDGWSRDLREAAIFTDPAEAEAALARALARPAEAVGCYLAPVASTPHGPEPLHFREKFRRNGPSINASGKPAAA